MKKQNSRRKMKNSFGGLINTVKICDERFSELEEMSIATSKTEMQRE